MSDKNSRPTRLPAVVRWNQRHAEAAARTGPPVARTVLLGLARLLALLGWLLALLVMLDALLVTFSANPTNGWASAIQSLAPRLSLGLSRLALTPIPIANLWVDHAIAAVVWVVVGTLLGLLVGRIAARADRH